MSTPPFTLTAKNVFGCITNHSTVIQALNSMTKYCVNSSQSKGALISIAVFGGSHPTVYQEEIGTLSCDSRKSGVSLVHGVFDLMKSTTEQIYRVTHSPHGLSSKTMNIPTGAFAGCVKFYAQTANGRREILICIARDHSPSQGSVVDEPVALVIGELLGFTPETDISILTAGVHKNLLQETLRRGIIIPSMWR